MAPALLYLFFFLSGISGLVYQVVWVRAFGTVFGNTVQSASIVIAIFMLGLGVGGYVIGAWADRRYEWKPDSLLRTYGYVELVIAALGLIVSLVLPTLDALSAMASSYVVDDRGWFVLSPMSYVARGAIAVVLLAPITVLMGGTLTLLVRHRVRHDVETAAGWEIALLYAANTVGAAAGAFLTDFALVPAAGLFATQMMAVALNVVAGAGALVLVRWPVQKDRPYGRVGRVLSDAPETSAGIHPVVWTGLALALSGFAAMGIEMLWLRHFNLLLGGFRSVFSLVLSVVLLGMAAGSILGGVIDRRTGTPARHLMLVQALMVLFVLAGLATASFEELVDEGRSIDLAVAALTPFARSIAELWYLTKPILLEVGIPAVLMGCSFPLANAIVQQTERAVGRRAGVLYLANTAGAVAGSLVTGYVLLPAVGMQGSAMVLSIIAGLAIAPLYLAAARHAPREDRDRSLGAGRRALVSGSIVAIAVAAWIFLPADYIRQRSMAAYAPGERLLAVSEATTEIIAVTEAAGRGRGLITNGHPMSSTAPLDQRYMRALAHIPLLSSDRPARVLVIGFGVGNTSHAAALHPSVERIDVADLSRHVLEHAVYFRDANRDVLADPRVTVYVNDGRQHLQMQPAASYDLITLEPPPIAHAGVAALYSREFYALARTRLRPGGYLSQWLPAYQVPAETSLAMIRAFIDVFPQSVLLSGTQAELLLVGTSAGRIEIDPQQLARSLDQAPQVQADLRRFDLGTVKEIVGTFVASAETLARATRQSSAAADDRPIQEYGVRSAIGTGLRGVPASLFELSTAESWCPRCFEAGPAARPVSGLDTYLALLEIAYRSSVTEVPQTHGRRILGSAYLGAVLPDTDAVHNLVGIALLREGRHMEAIAAFRDALARREDSFDANRNLGTALAESGRIAEAIGYLQRAVELEPDEAGAQHELGSLLLGRGEFARAARHLRVAVRATPGSAAAHNDLGVALASAGELDEAIAHFTQAVTLEPTFAEARRNLASARGAQR